MDYKGKWGQCKFLRFCFVCLGQFDFALLDRWCSLQSNRVVSVDNLLVTLEDPEDHRVSG